MENMRILEGAFSDLCQAYNEKKFKPIWKQTSLVFYIIYLLFIKMVCFNDSFIY